MTRRRGAAAAVARVLVPAALALGAAGLSPSVAVAGSCCGGGGSSALVLPKSLRGMVDLSFEWEKYDGFWNQNGNHIPDPPGSDLNQYRVNLATAVRLASRWQAGVTVPYVWNVNKYAGFTSRTDGLGDSTVFVFYEAIEERSAWKMKTLSDLVPSVAIGPSLLVPTGRSPYDDVNSSFDVTGRGFYRIDANLVVDKTYHPLTANVTLAYGWHIERPVNEEYGRYVRPYRKNLGDRSLASVSLGYIHFVGSAGDKLTATGSMTWLHEGEGTIDKATDPTSGFRKTAVGAQLTWSSTDHDWSARAGWSHAIREDGWGRNFPTTDVYTIGVRYGFR